MDNEKGLELEQVQEEKKGGGCFSPGCLVIAVAALALVYYGFVMPGKELPVISLAAELIPGTELPIPGFDHGIPNTLPTAMMTALVLIIIALFFLLPILSGNAPLPEDMSASQIGSFLGGFVRYWIDALMTAFGGE